MTKDYNTDNPEGDYNFASLITEYFRTRIGQIGIMFSTLAELVWGATGNTKSLLVRNMYWGRTSFYKQSFHILVIIITVVALYSGLGPRIVSSQKISVQNVSYSEGNTWDSDIAFQRGALFPLSELDGDSDSLYWNYTVVADDNLSKIASVNQISANTIRWANNIPNDRDTLSVGQVIRIPKVDGVLYTVKSGDTIDSIMAKVKLNDKDADILTFKDLNNKAFDENGALIAGSVVILYNASILPPPPPKKTLTGTTTKGGTKVNPGGSGLNVPNGSFVNPHQLCPYNFSRGYKRGHTGVDLAGPEGCWIVAAGNGTVVRAGWCPGGLGFCVQIKHANGFSTIYGHGNGVVAVNAGDNVSAGQKILQEGHSGNASGTHLHLSMTANGDDVYGCYSCRINPQGIIPY